MADPAVQTGSEIAGQDTTLNRAVRSTGSTAEGHKTQGSAHADRPSSKSGSTKSTDADFDYGGAAIKLLLLGDSPKQQAERNRIYEHLREQVRHYPVLYVYGWTTLRIIVPFTILAGFFTLVCFGWPQNRIPACSTWATIRWFLVDVLIGTLSLLWFLAILTYGYAIIRSLRTWFHLGVLLFGVCFLILFALGALFGPVIVNTVRFSSTETLVFTRPGFTDSNSWLTCSPLRQNGGCEARLSPEQASILRNPEDWYTSLGVVPGPETWPADDPRLTQPVEDGLDPSSIVVIDQVKFRALEEEHAVCQAGFEVDQDISGLGMRLGTYLQWIASMLSGQFLGEDGNMAQKMYLLLHATLCLVTYVQSFSACTFGIEIEILHWFYWGGVLCVFVSRPSHARFGKSPQWAKLDWSTLLLYATHTMMFYHGVWFFALGYDSFAKLPCGTWHFYPMPVLEPLGDFYSIRAAVFLLSAVLVMPWCLAIPIGWFSMGYEVLDRFDSLFVVRGLKRLAEAFDRRFLGPHRHSELLGVEQHSKDLSTISKLLERITNATMRFSEFYQKMRAEFGLPPNERPGIRLVTPIKTKHHRYVRP